MEPPPLLSADHVFSSDHRTAPCRGTVIGPVRHGQVRFGIKTHRRLGTTVTGNGDPIIVRDHRHRRNRRCRVELFQSHRRLLLIGNAMTLIAIPYRTRSSFGTYNRHPGPQKADWLARL